MGILDRWLGRQGGGGRFDGTHGRPPSGNGASSFHLFWDVPAAGRCIGAEATIEVVEPPAVPALFFWALQVSFVDGRGRDGGGAHFGLQWIDLHPGGTAVNWGGYRPGGGELDGSRSPLPSRAGNLNTRDHPWSPHRPYRYRVVLDPEAEAPAGLAAWRGELVDLTEGTTTVVRHLWAAGDRVGSPMVWSEVFAACDDPPAAVRWSDLALLGDDGRRVPVDAVSVNYQSVADGGCTTTDVEVDAVGVVQRTSTTRRTPAGARLTVPRAPA